MAIDILTAEITEAARLDNTIEQNEADRLSLLLALLGNPATRDEDLFAIYGADIDATIEDFAKIDPRSRDMYWLGGVGSLLAAAKVQTLLSFRPQIDALVLSRRKAYSAADRSSGSLKELGKKGFAARDVDDAKKTVDPVSAKESAPQDLAADAEQLIDIGALQSPAQAQVAESSRLSKIVEYPGDSPQWEAAIGTIVAAAATSGQKALARRVVQTESSVFMAGAGAMVDKYQRYAWVTCHDKNVCEPCDEMGGKIGTYDSFETKPGAETCLGGDNCRCDLVPVFDD